MEAAKAVIAGARFAVIGSDDAIGSKPDRLRLDDCAATVSPRVRARRRNLVKQHDGGGGGERRQDQDNQRLQKSPRREKEQEMVSNRSLSTAVHRTRDNYPGASFANGLESPISAQEKFIRQ